MDEEMAWQDVASLCTLLEATAAKRKRKAANTKRSPMRKGSHLKNLEQYPIRHACSWPGSCSGIGVHTLVQSTQQHLSIHYRWDSVIGPSGCWRHPSPLTPQWWLGSEDPDTLYAHVGCCCPWCCCVILKVAECCKQGNHGADPVRFVYSAVVVFVSSCTGLVVYWECSGLLQTSVHAHSTRQLFPAGWCILCKLPHYETSRYFPANSLPAVLGCCPLLQTHGLRLCLDSTSCDADCMLIWKLHRIRHHNTDYAMMPPAFRTSLMLSWEIWMEEYSKLWENEVFMMLKAGSPGVDVSLAMNFVCTCCTEYNAQRMILDISNATIIRLPGSPGGWGRCRQFYQRDPRQWWWWWQWRWCGWGYSANGHRNRHKVGQLWLPR